MSALSRLSFKAMRALVWFDWCMDDLIEFDPDWDPQAEEAEEHYEKVEADELFNSWEVRHA